MSKNNTIEINGKQYDARTGALLTTATEQPVRHETPPAKQIQAKTVSKVDSKPKRSSAAHNIRKAQSSKTLMRHAVKKPRKQPATRQDLVHAVASSPARVLHKTAAQRVDHHRAIKAKLINQSRLIQHFSRTTSDAPGNTPKLPVTNVAQPSSQPVSAPVKAAHRQHKPKTTSEILEHALQHSKSHQQAAPAKKRSRKIRAASVSALVAILALGIGFTIHQNTPSIRMQTATAQAGFSASLPEYQTPGFRLGDIDYADGVIASTFYSTSDDRSYRITQEKTVQDNDSLRDSFVAPLDSQYQTIEHNGQTLFLYGKGNATWVNDGVWYIITSDQALSTTQLVQLATSF